jgi:hypothetical protein
MIRILMLLHKKATCEWDVPSAASNAEPSSTLLYCGSRCEEQGTQKTDHVLLRKLQAMGLQLLFHQPTPSRN